MDIPYAKRATILVVDDQQFNLSLMSKLLKDNYNVEIAHNGKEALDIVASGLSIDLILLDVMMTGMDGYEVCRRLKQAHKTMNIPIIFITAMAEVNDETKGFELGAVDYITKPISAPIVLARVRNQLTLKAMADFLRDQNDWDIAERLAFTLKGISGNVSITGLQQFADKLDAAIVEHRANKQASQPDIFMKNFEQKIQGE